MLRQLARRHYLDLERGRLEGAASVRADLLEGSARGVVDRPTSSPLRVASCPALDVQLDGQGHLRIHADPEGIDVFVRACLA